MRVRFSPRAIKDIDEIVEHIAEDDIDVALEFGATLYDRAKEIGFTPHAYPEHAEIRKGLRVRPYKAYMLYYTVDKNGVRIVRVLHGARLPGPHLNP